MKSRTVTCITTMTLFAAVAFPIWMAAQEYQDDNHRKHHHYKFIDIGSLGGPNSYFSAGGIGNLVLNNRGRVAGYGDTSAPDPYAPNFCFDLDCFLAHAFQWQNGVLTDLGALPGVNNSAVSGINARGWIAGFSQNGVIDPLTGSPEIDAVLWKAGEYLDHQTGIEALLEAFTRFSATRAKPRSGAGKARVFTIIKAKGGAGAIRPWTIWSLSKAFTSRSRDSIRLLSSRPAMISPIFAFWHHALYL